MVTSIVLLCSIAPQANVRANRHVTIEANSEEDITSEIQINQWNIQTTTPTHLKDSEFPMLSSSPTSVMMIRAHYCNSATSPDPEVTIDPALNGMFLTGSKDQLYQKLVTEIKKEEPKRRSVLRLSPRVTQHWQPTYTRYGTHSA